MNLVISKPWWISLSVQSSKGIYKVMEKVDLGINMFPHSICTERLCCCSLNLGNYRHFPVLWKTFGKQQEEVPSFSVFKAGFLALLQGNANSQSFSLGANGLFSLHWILPGMSSQQQSLAWKIHLEQLVPKREEGKPIRGCGGQLQQPSGPVTPAGRGGH